MTSQTQVQHTPWNSHDCPRCNGTGEERYSQLPGNGPDLCQFCHGLGSVDYRLIASAPELLKALETLVAMDNCNYERDTMRYEGAFDRAREAIARARGED
jgi:DnaJ-class molecular chaperone